MLEVEWTNQALDKIEQISEFISLDSSSAATKWAELIFSKEMVLIDSPKIGRKVPEYKDESIREIIVGNYRLVYRRRFQSPSATGFPVNIERYISPAV